MSVTDTGYDAHLINPSHKLIIPKKPCYVKCCNSMWYLLSYLLFGYVCADGALLIYLNNPNRTETIGNHTINIHDIDTPDGKRSLWVSGSIGVFSLCAMGTYKLVKKCCGCT